MNEHKQNEQPAPHVTFQVVSVTPNVTIGTVVVGTVFTDRDAALTWLRYPEWQPSDGRPIAPFLRAL